MSIASSSFDLSGRYTVSAATVADLQEVRELFLEYQESLGFSLCFQGFQEELDSLPGKYAPPNGALLLARDREGRAVGVVALRPTETERECEMKRLYVRPEGRGLRLGQTLIMLIMDTARQLGYRSIRLDTVPGKMDRAIDMYRQNGFVETSPYYNPPLEHVLFMRREL